MLKVLFFARLREELGCGSLELSWSEAPTSPAALRETLVEAHGPRWREALCDDNVLCAVNHTIVGDDVVLRDGDEVAFFPPVTGG